MKIINWNERKDKVSNEVDVGEITDSEKAILQKVIDWNNKFSITGTLILCKDYSIKLDEDNEPYVDFEF